MQRVERIYPIPGDIKTLQQEAVFDNHDGVGYITEKVDALGGKIRELLQGIFAAGYHQVEFIYPEGTYGYLHLDESGKVSNGFTGHHDPSYSELTGITRITAR